MARNLEGVETLPTDKRAAERDLAVRLTAEFPDIPAESVLRCVVDAADAVDYFDVDKGARPALLERLARAHMENLTAAYNTAAESD